MWEIAENTSFWKLIPVPHRMTVSGPSIERGPWLDLLWLKCAFSLLICVVDVDLKLTSTFGFGKIGGPLISPTGYVYVRSQDAFDHNKGPKSAILGRHLHWNFPGFRAEKEHRLLSRLWLSWFSRSRSSLSIYMYICCRVKTWSKIWGFLSQNLVQGCVKTWSKIFFGLFFPSFIVFFGYLKKHK